jgi:GcrA cell cycle regulator
MGWTDERTDLLKKFWQDGLSASQIAKQLGGVTRNAVIGKVRRLGLPRRSPEASRVASNVNYAANRAATPKTPKTPKPSKAMGHAWFSGTGSKPPQPVETTKPAAAIPLAARHWETRAARGECAFPIEQPDGSIWSCCNPAPDTPDWCYCAQHADLMTRKVIDWTPAQRERFAERARKALATKRARRAA